MSTVIFRTAARLLVPLSLIFAVYIYFKGHQTPGGGFVAGLVTAVALAIHRMAESQRSLRRLLLADEITLIALGLGLSLGTGVLALAAQLPFLSSNFGYVPLPDPAGIAGPSEVHATFEWATVMVFDLGVMLVVAGVVIGMINALWQEPE